MNVTKKRKVGFNQKILHTYGRHIPESVIPENLNRILKVESDDETSSAASTVSSFCSGRSKNKQAYDPFSNFRNIDFGNVDVEGSIKTCKTTAFESRVIVAVTCGRGHARQEVGIAKIDLQQSLLILSQISDTQDFHSSISAINVLNPKEVLVPATLTENPFPNELLKSLNGYLRNVNVVSVQRTYYNSEAGLSQMNFICANEFNSILLILQHKFYALAAGAALLKYLEVKYDIYFSKASVRIDFQLPEFLTVIDVDTADRLELVSCLAGNIKNATLLDILDHCCTPGGSRLLRANILQPLNDTVAIEQRLDCVEELMSNAKLLSDIRNFLKSLIDCDKILSFGVISNQKSVKMAECQLNYVLLLKSYLEKIPYLVDLIKDGQCTVLSMMRDTLCKPEYQRLLEIICEVLHEDAHIAKGQAGCLQRCFAVKPDINSFLDLNRSQYTKVIEEMRQYVDQLSVKTELSLRLNNNVKKGFHLIYSVSRNHNFDFSKLSQVFLQVEKKGNTIAMTTLEMISFQQRLNKVLATIERISSVVVYDILIKIRSHVGSIYLLNEMITYLDMLQSLACVKTTHNSVRPKFANYLELQDAFNPYLLYLHEFEPIPNSIISTKHTNFNLITGPNMSGKSIFLKLVALTQIMAQIGCFVFAKTAVFRIVDSIFSRIGFDDNLEFGASTFVLEMKEMQHILNKMNNNSLIIIDELCRSTNSDEGFHLAWAISERLIESSSMVFFATHYTNLANLQDYYYSVQVEEEDDENNDGDVKLNYLHKLNEGVQTISQYGLRLAKTTGLPKSMINNAYDLYSKILPSKTPLGKNHSIDLKNYERICYQSTAKISALVTSEHLTDERFQSILDQARSNVEFMKIHEEISEADITRQTDENTSRYFESSTTRSAYDESVWSSNLDSSGVKSAGVDESVLTQTTSSRMGYSDLNNNCETICDYETNNTHKTAFLGTSSTVSGYFRPGFENLVRQHFLESRKNALANSKSSVKPNS